jgi:uncharacterized repeat protein (TIGR01451 family)
MFVMKKNYTRLILGFTFSFFISFSTFAQPTAVANDDVVSVPTGTIQTVIANVLANDGLYFGDANLSNIVLTPLTSSNPGIQLDADGSVNIIQNGLPVGSYKLSYQICDIADSNVCDIGNVTVFVGICMVDAPVVAEYTIIYCNSLAAITISNLPASSSWTVRVLKDGVFLTNLFGNTTSTTSLFINSPGIYTFYISDNGNGCMSPSVELIATAATCGLNMYYNGNYFDFNDNNLVDAGDTINYFFSVSNNVNSAVTNINLTSPNINISAMEIPVLNADAFNNNNPLGTHIITQSEIDAQEVVTKVTATATLNGVNVSTSYNYTKFIGNINGIGLSAFIDTNGNGVKDSGEIVCPFGKFSYEKNNDGNVIERWNSGYEMIYENNPANSYDISFIVDGNYASYYVANTSSYNDITVSGSGVMHYRFAVSVLPYNDLKVSLYPGVLPRPGFVYDNTVVIRNMSNLPVASAIITFTMDGAVSLVQTNPSDITHTANGFTYNFTNLMPYEARTLEIEMQVPTIPTVALGQQVTNSVTLATAVSETDLGNNSDSFTADIVGSYDPNDKLEHHGGKILYTAFSANDYLTYTIRFENTGTAEAYNVKVTDLLNEKLDETSVRMVDASAAYVLDRNGNNLTWKFDGINLPPSVANSNIGHGYLIFQVKPKAGYAVGDIITNTADIFFDFNPAIVTNTTETEFVAALGVDEFDTSNFTLYPNPTSNLVNVVMKSGPIETVSVSDMLGKTVLSKVVNTNATQMDLSELSAGIYLVKVTAKGKEKVFKLIKE